MVSSNKLSERLKDMLLETSPSAGGDNGGIQSSSTSRPLIEVVAAENENNENNGADSAVVDDDDDDDDCPPPISFHGTTAAKPTLLPTPPSLSAVVAAAQTNDIKSATTQQTLNSSSTNANDNDDDVPTQSLAEQLLAEATIAKQKQQQQKMQRDQQRVKKSTFGLKKGFLNASSSTSNIGKKKKMKQGGGKNGLTKDGQGIGENSEGHVHGSSKSVFGGEVKDDGNLIYELDSDGNMLPTKPSTGSKSNNGNSNPLQLPEVQSAMLNHLQSTSSQWATPELLASISQNHPKLAQGMANPKYMSALQSMQSNPTETIERLRKNDPDIMEWLLEFCAIMGEHFVGLGEKGGQDGKKKEGGGREKEGGSFEDARVREMGPLEKKALEKNQQQQQQKQKPQTKSSTKSSFKQSTPQTSTNTTTTTSNNAANNDMDNQVASILANDELRSILMDPKMQQIMEECGTTGSKLRYYMSHPEVGPKLRMLMDAELLRFA